MSTSYKNYYKQLNKIKEQIIKGTCKGNPKKWQNKDYEDLSFNIKLKTSVLISKSTLKRIFGKSKTGDRYFPQPATYDALVKYAESFELSGTKKYRINYRKIALLSSILFFIVFCFVIFLPKLLKDNTKPTIKFVKLEGYNPSSAFFEYTIPDTKDYYYIDFGDGIGRRSELLDPQNHKITHFYRYAGVFKVKIMSENGVESKVNHVLIPTDGWQSITYYYDVPHSQREFYPLLMERSIKNGMFHPPTDYLSSIGIDTNRRLMTQLANFTKTDIGGDSFVFKTRIKTVNFWPRVRCYSAYLEVAGTKGCVLMMFTTEGCSHWTYLDINGEIFEGKNTDLSNFIVDLKNWKDIQITNKNKNLKVTVDNELIYTKKYENSIGNINGVSIIFVSNGYIDYVKLFDQKGNLILGTDF